MYIYISQETGFIHVIYILQATLILLFLFIFCSKLKKMYRTIQEQKGNRGAEDAEDEAEEKRPKQQFDKDFTLEPFEGVSPEYMEMSESPLVSCLKFIH